MKIIKWARQVVELLQSIDARLKRLEKLSECVQERDYYGRYQPAKIRTTDSEL